MSGKVFTVCHMLTSLDGKIDGDFFTAPETASALKAYGELRKFYRCNATLYGTTTMLGGYAGGTVSELPSGSRTVSENDWINPEGKAIENFIVSVDPKGELAFSSHILEKKGRPAAHVIEALTEQASSEYLSYLRRKGISHLIAGKKRLDCTLLLEKLQSLFGIGRLMVAGGGTVNWSFLQEGLIDELSLVIAPVADGSTTAVSIFEQSALLPYHRPVGFALKEARPLDGDALWLRYVKKIHCPPSSCAKADERRTGKKNFL